MIFTRKDKEELDKSRDKLHAERLAAAKKSINSIFNSVCKTCGYVHSVTCPDKKHLGEKTHTLAFYIINPHTERGKKTLLTDACGKTITVEKYYKTYDKYHAY
jgi:hypothetical protein